MISRPLNRQTLIVQNKISDRDKLHEFLIEYVESHDIPGDTYNDLRLVIEEAFTNIINHAYTDNKSHTVTVELNNTESAIVITFTDTGIEFDPLTDCGELDEKADHGEGGMGMHIIKSLTDSQEYHRINQHNVFTVTKLYTKKNRTPE
jgi:anti-sigma regulatory factor (Ser/Thr protein kinase)